VALFTPDVDQRLKDRKARAVRRVACSPSVSRWMISKVFHAQLSGRLPIDKIKIDQSFVRRPQGDAEAAAAINAGAAQPPARQIDICRRHKDA